MQRWLAWESWDPCPPIRQWELLKTVRNQDHIHDWTFRINDEFNWFESCGKNMCSILVTDLDWTTIRVFIFTFSFSGTKWINLVRGCKVSYHVYRTLLGLVVIHQNISNTIITSKNIGETHVPIWYFFQENRKIISTGLVIFVVKFCFRNLCT